MTIMVTGGRAGDEHGGGRRRLTAIRRTRGERREDGDVQEDRELTLSTCGVLGGGGGGLERRRIVAAVGGRRRRRRGRRRRSRAPELDSCEEEEEDDEAELMARFDLLREAPVDGGDAAAATARSRPWRRLGLGFLQRGEKEGEEEQQVAGGLFILQGGPGSEEERGEATATRRPWRQCFPCRHREEGADRWGPCQGFILFPFFQKFQ